MILGERAEYTTDQSIMFSMDILATAIKEAKYKLAAIKMWVYASECDTNSLCFQAGDI